MNSSSSRGKRLLARYPVLAPVPEAKRPEVVRAALRHPIVLLLVLGGGLLLLPVYFGFAFSFLKVAQETDIILKTAKLAASIVIPLCIIVPLLSHFLIPHFIRREMRKRGYDGKAPEKPANTPQ